MIALRDTCAAEIAAIVRRLFAVDIEPQISVPEAEHGDLTTNVAMQLAGRLGRSPRDIAETIAAELGDAASVAGPGFINLRVNDDDLFTQATKRSVTTYKDQTVIVEYSDMNAFKTAHAGHLYTTLVGNAIANIIEASGARVIRANFGGDVGRHAAIALWAIMRDRANDPNRLGEIEPSERSAWVAARYVDGTAAYESDETAKTAIDELNAALYRLIDEDDHSSLLAQFYWTTRQWSYDGFEQFYDQLGLTKQPDGTYFHYYPESTTAPFGKRLVEEARAQGVFTESAGAIVYQGETEGLHTRVFLTKAGLPTYETKDLGLAVRKWDEYHFDRNIIVTANDITDYMKVVLAALHHIRPEISERTTHITHGLIKLEGGAKMSSRRGNVVVPEEILHRANEENTAISGKHQPEVAMGAVKYAFLKQRIGGDIIYDPKASVSLTGNSGPYLLYALVRARAILKKEQRSDDDEPGPIVLEAGERALVRKLAEYQTVLGEATTAITPHILCTYLYELATQFNQFYEHNKVIGHEREALRTRIVQLYEATLDSGLTLLGIHTPDHM
jgi:arginyl-tRNA synthetase